MLVVKLGSVSPILTGSISVFTHSDLNALTPNTQELCGEMGDDEDWD